MKSVSSEMSLLSRRTLIVSYNAFTWKLRDILENVSRLMSLFIRHFLICLF
jgi:hypothetical protein